VSNRKRSRPPAPDAAVDALLAAVRCADCGSTKALRRWDRQVGKWVITPLHAESCPVRKGVIAPHAIPENAAAAARDSGFPGLAYQRDHDGGSGGSVTAGGC
jgi:hypothetical protein